MGQIRSFEDLNVWKESRALAQEIYLCLISKERIKDYSLKDQINRSSGSIMDNIAEGYERQGNKEFRQFLGFARGSAGEVKSQLYRAFDRSYIEDDSFNDLFKRTQSISKMLNGLIKYINSSKYRGSKFEEPNVGYNKTNQPID